LLGANQQIEAVQRLIPSPAPLSSVIKSLVVGPTNSEAVAGITTAIPSSVEVLSVTTVGTTVTVNFNSAFADITGAATEIAVSQVVYTVAAQNGIGTGVIFEIGGIRTSVPVASGAEVLGPVNALEFVTAPSTPTTVAPAAP
jgi:spore germination protein GerM